MGIHAMQECSELLTCIIAATLERRSARRAGVQFSSASDGATQLQSPQACSFHDPGTGVISLLDVVSQVSGSCRTTPVALLAALVLLDRVAPTLALTEETVVRMFSVAVTIATKFVEDLYEANTHYARIVGVDLECYNALEVAFLRAIRFDARISQAELDAMDVSALFDACDSCYGSIIRPALKDAHIEMPSARPVAPKVEPDAVFPANGGVGSRSRSSSMCDHGREPAVVGCPLAFSPLPWERRLSMCSSSSAWSVGSPEKSKKDYLPSSPMSECSSPRRSSSRILSGDFAVESAEPCSGNDLGSCGASCSCMDEDDIAVQWYLDVGSSAPSYQYFDEALELAHGPCLVCVAEEEDTGEMPAWAR